MILPPDLVDRAALAAAAGTRDFALPGASPGLAWLVFHVTTLSSSSSQDDAALVRGAIEGGVHAARWRDLAAMPGVQDALRSFGSPSPRQMYEATSFCGVAVEVPTHLASPLLHYVLASSGRWSASVEGGRAFAADILRAARQHASKRPW